MVFIDSDRMYTVTEAKPKLHALIAEAHQGGIIHLVKGSEVVAHLVGPSARLVDDRRLLASLTRALLATQADDIANTFQDGQFHGQAGEPLGRLFAWAWQTDKDLFMGYVADLHALISGKLQRNLNAEAVVGLLDGALEARLPRGENDAACRYALSQAPDWLLPWKAHSPAS